MVINPAVILGLGATATQALDEIALGVMQGYGESALEQIALLGLDFVERQPSAPVQHLTISADGLESAALAGWFDRTYYLGNRARPALSDRQVARATFLAFLAQHSPSRLDAFLRTPIQRMLSRRSSVAPSTISTAPIMTHVFAALEDDASALLLDVVNFTYRTLRQLAQETRLIIHVMLPASLLQGETRATRHYAALRELERFSISYGDTMHVIYPPDSGLEDINVPSSLLIFGVKFYAPGTEWSDVLLPQLDSSETGFAPRYLQINVANWNAWRDHQIERSGSRHSLYAGTYSTRSAIFPVERLRRLWTARLAYETLREWVGVDSAQINLDSLWTARTTPDGQRVSSPEVTRWLLRGDKALVRTLDSAEAVCNVMFQSEMSSAFLNALRVEHASVLDWLPVAAEFSQGDPHQITQAVKEAMVLQVGAWNFDLSAGSELPLYQKALLKIVEAQHQRFIESLDAFLIEALHSQAGVQSMLPFLQKNVVTPLEKVTTQLGDATRAWAKALVRQDIEESLKRAARRIPAQRCWFGGEPPEVRDYFERAQQITEQLKTYRALLSLSELAERFYHTAVARLSALDKWHGVLQEMLLQAEKAANAANKDQLTNSANRLWLVDSGWIEMMYQRLCVDEPLRAGLRWQMHEGRASIHLNGRALVPEHLDLADWLEAAREKVLTLRLDLWDDYLQDRYEALFPALQTFFTVSTKQPWYKDAFIESDTMIVPLGLPDDLVQPLHNHLEQKLVLREADLLNHDPTRIVRYSAAEVFPLEQIAGIERVEAAYRNLNRQQRTRLHVLPAEVEAVEWEARAHDQLNLKLRFSGSVVALFADRAAMEQFVRLEALGLIRRAEYDRSSFGYALVIDEQYWWLSRAGRLSAITALVFDDKPHPFGRPPSVSESPLPREDFDAAVERTLQNRVYSKTKNHTPNEHPDYPDAALSRVMQILDQQAHLRTWAQVLAEEATALLVYHRQLLNDAHEKKRDEYDLSIVLALISKVLYDQMLAALRSRVY